MDSKDTQRERERARREKREWARRESTGGRPAKLWPAQIVPPPLPPPPPRSRRLTAQITGRPSFLFFFLSSSSTLLLPLQLPTTHRRGQFELRSWQPTAGHAPLGSPTHLSAVFLLPLAQCCQSGHHQPPTHPTPPLNPPDLATTVLHPLRSLSFLIYLFFPQFVTLSSSSHRVYPIYVVNKCFYFDFCLC